MMEEEWRDVDGYDYEVSSMGRVRRKGKEVCLKPLSARGGYCRIYLYAGPERQRFLIHRLVAMAFLPNPDNLPQVDHINNIKDDNRLDNLRWCTPSQNSCNYKCHRPISGYKGVSKSHNRWKAVIECQRKVIYIGTFDTPEEAHEAYKKKATELHRDFAKW